MVKLNGKAAECSDEFSRRKKGREHKSFSNAAK